MSDQCSACGQVVSGRFCSHCGAPTGGPTPCAACGAELLPAARYCNQCGASAAAGDQEAGRQGPSTRTTPWIVAGVAVIGLVGVVVTQRFGAEPQPQIALGPPPPAAAPAGPGAIDLSSMTPREAADRLFDRIMRTAGAGDSAQARAFVPMALEAYRQLDDLDADAHYHLAVLHMLVDNPAEARSHADAILTDEPDHLFGLFMAGQSADRLGNDDEARALFRRFLDRYSTEIARDLPEYSAHSPVFPEMRAEAQAFVR